MTSIDDLVAEAQRQLTICNACRYCEGYCAVYPALARRDALTGGDITQLANLCHDCRACFDACMYAPPHEFEVNVPQVLSAIRTTSYDRLVSRPKRATRLGWWAAAAVSLVMAVLVIVVAAVRGSDGLHPGHGSAESPYAVIALPALLAVVLAACAWSALVFVRAGLRYWREVDGDLSHLLDIRSHGRAFLAAAELRNLRGGGDGCYFPGDRPSAIRRRLHHAVAYGALLAFVSTVAAGIEEHLVHANPPYPYLSLPVLSGLIGGIAMTIGCTGLLLVRATRRRDLEFEEMGRRGTAFIVALDALAVTGLLTLFARTTPLFGVILILHLAVVVVSFALVPYSKFMHLLYRYLALVRDVREAQPASG